MDMATTTVDDMDDIPGDPWAQGRRSRPSPGTGRPSGHQAEEPLPRQPRPGLDLAPQARRGSGLEVGEILEDGGVRYCGVMSSFCRGRYGGSWEEKTRLVWLDIMSVGYRLQVGCYFLRCFVGVAIWLATASRSISFSGFFSASIRLASRISPAATLASRSSVS